MSHNITFSKALQRLYFNVQIQKNSAGSIISKLTSIDHLKHEEKTKSALSLNMASSLKDNTGKKSVHLFKFTESPLPDYKIDSGYIRVEISENNKFIKLLDIEWCIQFHSKVNAENYFDHLIKIFTPLSTINRVDIDKETKGQFAEFSTRDSGQSGIRDITFLFVKPLSSDLYEIRMLPYNEFSD